MSSPADPPDDVHPDALEALLRWYVAMGVDASVAEAACDRMSEPSPPRGGQARRVSERARPASQADALPAPQSASAPDEIAAQCQSLDELRVVWARNPGSGLATSATHMIFAGGRPGAGLMIFGGAPDSDDEREGSAYCGAKGRLLDAMLRALQLTREDVYLAYVVPWRPPGNRVPSPSELDACLPFVHRHIELAAPSVLLCLGERAAHPLLGTTDPIGRLRGRWLTYEGRAQTTRSLVTFSLENLLKQPLQKRRAWKDLLQLAEVLG